MSTEEFDPATVPVFPVISVEISTANHTVTVAGRPVDTTGATDLGALTDLAVERAAQEVRSHHLDHARVAAAVDDDRYSLVVGADGSRHSLDRPTATAAGDPAKKPIWPILAAVGASVLVISLVAGFAVASQLRGQAPEPVEAAAPPAAELPIVPVDGWTTHATWAVPVSRRAPDGPVVLTGDTVIAVSPDADAVTNSDALTAYEADTGRTAWKSALPGTLVAGPELTTIDGEEAIAVVTTEGLSWWPATGSAEPTGTVALEASEEVTFDGTSPLISGRGQQARIIANGTDEARTIPAGATALRADGDTVLAVDAQAQLWHLDNTDPHVPDPTLLEKIPDGSQTTVLGTAGDLIALRWSSDQAAELRLYTLDGQKAGKPKPDAGTEWTSTEKHGVSEPWVIDTTTGTAERIDTEGWTTDTITDAIYGRVNGELATLTPDGKVTTQSDPTATPPQASTDTHAYYIAEDNDGEPALYAVEAAG